MTSQSDLGLQYTGRDLISPFSSMVLKKSHAHFVEHICKIEKRIFGAEVNLFIFKFFVVLDKGVKSLSATKTKE